MFGLEVNFWSGNQELTLILIILLSFLIADLVYLRFSSEVKIEIADAFLIAIVLTLPFELGNSLALSLILLTIRAVRFLVQKYFHSRFPLLKLWARTSLEETISFSYLALFLGLWWIYGFLGYGQISLQLWLGLLQLSVVTLLYFISVLLKHYIGCVLLSVWYKSSFKTCAVPPLGAIFRVSLVTGFTGFLIALLLKVSFIAYILALLPTIPLFISLLNYTRVFIGTQRTIDNMARVIEAKIPQLRGHSDKVAEIALGIGKYMGLSLRELERLNVAARLQNIGYVVVSEDILAKPGPLTPEEWEEVKKHPGTADRILSNLSIYDEVRRIIKAHHERWDGRGYPDGLKGPQIPLEARIISLADAYVAMLSDRPYRRAKSLDETIKEIFLERGKAFDPMIVDKFIEYLINSGKLSMERYRQIIREAHQSKLTSLK